MKNPWKEKSKIDPQRERGNRQLASDVYHALIQAKLTGTEYQVCLFVIEMTWGFNKTSDTIAVPQFVYACQCSERQVRNAIKRLKEMRLIHYEKEESATRVHSGSPFNRFMFNKYYDTWLIWKYLRKDVKKVVEACGKLVRKRDLRVQSEVNKGAIGGSLRVHSGSPSKESIQKKYINSRQIERIICGKLNGIAKTRQVIEVLCQVPEKQWWRVEKFLRQRYPIDGSKGYQQAVHELQSQRSKPTSR